MKLQPLVETLLNRIRIEMSCPMVLEKGITEFGTYWVDYETHINYIINGQLEYDGFKCTCKISVQTAKDEKLIEVKDTQLIADTLRELLSKYYSN